MLTDEDNTLMTRVEPGQPMHAAFKRYWLPAARSSDIPDADSDPVRLTLLCETYVMFRDSGGQVGILRDRCCHRGASLGLGRVEDGGIRCLFHGWKFATDGRVLEMPNATDDRYLSRYRQPAFPVREAGGLIWVYLGPADQEPPFPRFPFLDLPVSHCLVEAPVANANFVQMLEGLVDSSHVGILHADSLTRNSGATMLSAKYEGALYRQMSKARAPELEAEDTDFGFRYAAIRREDDNGRQVTIARITAFALPCFGFIANGSTMVAAVPVTSERTNFFHVFWDADMPLSAQRRQHLRDYFGLNDKAMFEWGLAASARDLPTSASMANNFHQNRGAMRRNETFTGIVNFVPEDVAIAESQGPICDRTTESLIPADLAVTRLRRALLNNARLIQQGGEPIGVKSAEAPRGMQGIVAGKDAWRSLLEPRQKAKVEPA